MHASVYKCFLKSDEERLKPFACKVIREDDEEKIKVHKNEFEIMRKLDHKNIVKAYELYVNDHKKEIYIVMQYIDG